MQEQIVIRLEAELAEALRTEAALKGASVSDRVREILEAHFLPTPVRIEKKRQSEAFKAFWLSYPRKVGRGAAEKIWARLKPSEDVLNAMLKALSWQKGSDQWQDSQYIPHPSTWLNQQRWLDEPEQTEEDKTADFLERRRLEKQRT